jgi:hypothetical protein
MKLRLLLLLPTLALLASWAGKFHGTSWPDGHLFC